MVFSIRPPNIMSPERVSMVCFTRSNARGLLASAALVAVAGALAGAMGAAPVGAQTYSSVLGVTGGWSTAGDLTPGLTETTLEDGWTAGAQLETWAGRYGVRLNATYAERNVVGSTRSFQVATADLGLMFRLVPPNRERAIAPFAGIGVGPVLYMADEGGAPLGDGDYGADPVIRWMVAPSVGADLLTHSPVGVRFEIADQIVFPSIGESPETSGLPRVHNPGVRVALQVRFGRPATPLVAVVPPAPTGPAQRADAAPAPAPAPTAAPAAPAPAPTLGGQGRLYTAQVGAFADEATARAWAGRLEARGLPVWLSEATLGGQRLIRLRVGAVDSPEDAELLATRLQRDFGYEAWIDGVASGETLPADAIVATLRYLFGQ
jgi:cell division septation protein DedD